jgi:YegS/Rv2252/BmrU family lipid kinase
VGQFHRALFIINPTSGSKKFPDLDQEIKSYCQKVGIESSIQKTERAGHATELAQSSINQNFDLVFAVGGDGTVNEVAKGLIHSSVTMSILPTGSGNGLARHLGIPMKPAKALTLVDSGKSIAIDTLSVNGEVSVNVSGIGFDGHIANLFGKSGKRGLKEYVSLAATEFRKFKNFSISGNIDGVTIQSEAFILAIANSSQFGNNATISPTASVCDQLMDICIVKKIPLLQALGFVGKMFTRRMHQSAFVKIIKSKKADFLFSADMPYHVDGEGRQTARKFSIELIPHSLKILAPSDNI